MCPHASRFHVGYRPCGSGRWAQIRHVAMRSSDVVVGIRHRYGGVDGVGHLQAAPSVADGLQRVGRAGHQVGEVSTGWFFPLHRADVVDAAVVTERMLTGSIEALDIPANPLDILAQQTIAAAAMDELTDQAWFELVR